MKRNYSLRSVTILVLFSLLQGLYSQNDQTVKLPVLRPGYGTLCGIVGAEPSGRRDIETLIHFTDTVGIILWLNDSIPERQAYAIEAISRLAKAKKLDSDFQQERVRSILNKNPRVQMCRGCLFGEEDIKTSLAKFIGQLSY